MATATQISIAQYHETSYEPDREYIDGELRERNVGKREHARLQALLTGWFLNNEKAWSVMVMTEERTQVAPSRVRIPDVLLTSLAPQTQTLTEPPILVVEILSPDDTYGDTQERAKDYMQMGVEAIWVIDPMIRSGRLCSKGLWQEGHRLEVPGTPIYVDLDDLFRFMNEPRS